LNKEGIKIRRIRNKQEGQQRRMRQHMSTVWQITMGKTVFTDCWGLKRVEVCVTMREVDSLKLKL
jgi:hypothetical protein